MELREQIAEIISNFCRPDECDDDISCIEHQLIVADKILELIQLKQYCQCEMKEPNNKSICINCGLPIDFKPKPKDRIHELPLVAQFEEIAGYKIYKNEVNLILKINQLISVVNELAEKVG